MDAIRDLVNTLGIQPEDFNYLIVLVIIVGGTWAAKRLYADLTGEPIDYENDPIEPIKIKLGRSKEKE